MVTAAAIAALPWGYLSTLTYRCDVSEELVGFTKACDSYHRSTGCQCPSHQVGILHPHVGAQHPPITGDVTRLWLWDTACMLRPAPSPSCPPG